MLPPWNYYLLFAITCHLSLLTACADKNRMTYGNLVICFQPCLRIDNFCFQFLVQKWRDCWQGCWTEKEALEEEYKVLDRLAKEGSTFNFGAAPGSSGGSSGGSAGGSNAPFTPPSTIYTTSVSTSDNRSIGSSSGYLNHTRAAGEVGSHGASDRAQQASRQLKLKIPATRTGDDVSSSSAGAGLPFRFNRESSRRERENGHARANSQLPPLTPMEPLSPIGL